MKHGDVNKTGTNKTDDRPAADRKPLADVRLDMELMNALAESQGTDSACLGKLMTRHEKLVWNTLRRWQVRPCDVDEVAGKVWEKVWDMSRVGAWDASRARHVRDPFVPLLKKICKSKALDFHKATGRARRRHERFAEAVVACGDDWRAQLVSSSRRRRR